MSIRLTTSLCCFAGLAIALAPLSRRRGADRLAAASPSAAVTSEPVEMFAAMKAGDLDVKIIPRDDREAKVFIKNNTKRPLSVRLPEAFAAVPVLGQRARGGGGQAGGGGMGGMGGGGMGGGGMFNLPAEGYFLVSGEQTRQINVQMVCLEHGKKDPRPSMAYEIVPIERFTSKPGVAELCAMLGYGKIDQRAAQVAAWHLSNDMSWAELATKHIEHLNGFDELYFSPDQIQGGIAAADAAIALAKEAKQAKAASEPAALPSAGTTPPDADPTTAPAAPAAAKRQPARTGNR